MLSHATVQLCAKANVRKKYERKQNGAARCFGEACHGEVFEYLYWNLVVDAGEDSNWEILLKKKFSVKHGTYFKLQASGGQLNAGLMQYFFCFIIPKSTNEFFRYSHKNE